MKKKAIRTSVLRFMIGAFVLIIGTFVYLIDRPPGDTYFVSQNRKDISLYGKLPPIFGRMGQNLPAFAHPFGFILITVAILNPGKKGILGVAGGWLLVESAFELGQKYGAAVAPYVPEWFSGIPFLENTKAFFQNGTFDCGDLVAVFAGCAGALIIIRLTDTNTSIRKKRSFT